MSYRGVHYRKIRSSKPTNVKKIINGDIVTFNYTSKKGGSGTRLVIVLNVWPLFGPIDKKFLHALDLTKISLPMFKKLLRILGEPSTWKVKEEESRRMTVPAGEKDGLTFYRQKIKVIPTALEAYRTYRLDKINVLKIADYDFETEDVLPKEAVDRSKAQKELEEVFPGMPSIEERVVDP